MNLNADTHTVLLLIGRSGCGKSAIAKGLKEQCGLTSVQSYTTRPKRYRNETGHIFVSESEFPPKEDRAAYSNFNGYDYCATWDQLKKNDIYIVDIDGLNDLLEADKEDINFFPCYINCSTLLSYKRMRKRGDSISRSLSRCAHDIFKLSKLRLRGIQVFELDGKLDLQTCIGTLGLLAHILGFITDSKNNE